MSFAQADPASKEAAGADADADKGPPVGGGGKNGKFTAKIKFDNEGYDLPEKVLQLDPKIGRTHTSFYA